MTESRHILVCGGAGYIGSHMCKRLWSEGIVPISFDWFDTEHRRTSKPGLLAQEDQLICVASAAFLRRLKCNNHSLRAVGSEAQNSAPPGFTQATRPPRPFVLHCARISSAKVESLHDVVT